MLTAAEVIRRQAERATRAARFEPPRDSAGATMKAVVTTGSGGPERLEYRDVPVPEPGPGGVLIEVLAAAVNATDVNTRTGWYGEGWDTPTPFPLVQGADCCGRVVALGADAPAALLGRRVIVRPCMRPWGFDSPQTVWLGSDFDGAYAQSVLAPASEVFPVECPLSDVELAALPCAWGTAQNLVHRARIGAGERVLVTGASGDVGSAAVQLAATAGAEVIALTSAGATGQVRSLGATLAIERDVDLVATLGRRSVDAVIDNVAGPSFGDLLEVLRPGGRYLTSGAVAGPQVSFDKRTLYLRDLTLIGCTAWDEAVFPQLVAAVGRGEVKPRVTATFALADVAAAQAAYLSRRRIGKVVLVPPAMEQ